MHIANLATTKVLFQICSFGFNPSFLFKTNPHHHQGHPFCLALPSIRHCLGFVGSSTGGFAWWIDWFWLLRLNLRAYALRTPAPPKFAKNQQKNWCSSAHFTAHKKIHPSDCFQTKRTNRMKKKPAPNLTRPCTKCRYISSRKQNRQVMYRIVSVPVSHKRQKLHFSRTGHTKAKLIPIVRRDGQNKQIQRRISTGANEQTNGPFSDHLLLHQIAFGLSKIAR